MIEPTAEEFRGWLGMPPGKYFKQYLKDEIRVLQDDWASRMFNSKENKEETAIANEEALGRVQQIGEILAKLDELTTEEEDEETTY